MKAPGEFTVKEKRSKLIYNSVLGAVSLSIIIVFAVLRIVNVLDDIAFFMMIAIGIFLVIAVIGICSYFKNAFKYKDGVFTHIQLFHKARSIKVVDLSCVIVARYAAGIHMSNLILFKDKSGKTVMTVSDSGELVRRNLLASVLTFYNVPFYKK